MVNDALVDEVRNNGLAFAARFNNDMAAICMALRDDERASGRTVVDRAVRGSDISFSDIPEAAQLTSTELR